MPVWLLTVCALIALVLGGCGNDETGQAAAGQPPSFGSPPSIQPTVEPVVDSIDGLTVLPTVQTTSQAAVYSTPTPVVLGPLFDTGYEITEGPINLPLVLQIPSLNVNAPVMGVGLNAWNAMDAPKGPIDDRVWHSAFWYRGSGIPGESGTATIAGHVNDPLGRPEIFADLEDLKPGDLITVLYTMLNVKIHFTVDQTVVYSTRESSDPAVLERIFGQGPVAGLEAQPALDGLSHLTLITCAGNLIDGQFDHHTVVYATRIP